MTAPPLSVNRLDADLSASLRSEGFAVLPDVARDADNASVLAIARRLGSVSLSALPQRSGLVEAAGVQRVEALAEAPRDQFDQPLLSGHHAAFALHSDQAFSASPCRYVLLHCWRADREGGGVSLLAERGQIEAAADRDTREALRTLSLPYAFADASTLGYTSLRYNRAEVMTAAARRQRPLSSNQLHWLDRFDRLFDRVKQSILLRPGELLVLDNHRLLHGRSAFAAGSDRLLKRLRVDAADPFSPGSA